MVTPRKNPVLIRSDRLKRLLAIALSGPVKLLSFDEIFKRMRKTEGGKRLTQIELALLIQEQQDRSVVESILFRARPHYRLRDPALGAVIHPSLAGEPGTPYAAFRRAEVLYLESSGWELHPSSGKWSHPRNGKDRFWTEAALLLQIHADEDLLVRKRLGVFIHERPPQARDRAH